MKSKLVNDFTSVFSKKTILLLISLQIAFINASYPFGSQDLYNDTTQVSQPQAQSSNNQNATSSNPSIPSIPPVSPGPSISFTNDFDNLNDEIKKLIRQTLETIQTKTSKMITKTLSANDEMIKELRENPQIDHESMTNKLLMQNEKLVDRSDFVMQLFHQNKILLPNFIKDKLQTFISGLHRKLSSEVEKKYKARTILIDNEFLIELETGKVPVVRNVLVGEADRMNETREYDQSKDNIRPESAKLEPTRQEIPIYKTTTWEMPGIIVFDTGEDSSSQ